MEAQVHGVLVKLLTDDLEVSAALLTADAELVADLGFDSLSFATTVSEVRERFGVALAKEDVFACRTFGDLQRAITDKVAGAQERAS